MAGVMRLEAMLRRHAWLKNANLIEWPLYLLRTSNYEFSEPFVDGGDFVSPPAPRIAPWTKTGKS